MNITNLNVQFAQIHAHLNNVLGRSHFRAKRNKLFVLNFEGDVMASQSKALANEINAILCNYDRGDKVLIKITSPGGAAHAYGYAASQIQRLKSAKIPVTVSIDKISASGGYMMACVAEHIIAAPYAIVGSIGVVAEFPNLFNLLQHLGIDYKQYTAGKYKRTVSSMAKITEEGEEKFKKDLNEMYDLFTEHVHYHRPHLDMEKVATGEHWNGVVAKKLGLVDEIKTSDEFILEHIQSMSILQLEFVGDKKSWLERFSFSLMNSLFKSFFEQLVNLGLIK
jgi:serine protease SohB